jgi:DNA-binding GntR family transcriptional regulator
VREALRRLAAEGLVNIAPNRQATVVQLSSAEVIETYEVRRILESAAARMAAENLSSGDLSTLRQLATTAATIDGLKHCDPERRFDDELHRTVAAGCGNTRLAAEISRYLNLVRLVRTRNQYDASALAKAHLEHEEILTALEAREPRAAEAAMSAHIASGLQYVLSHYFCK